MDSLLSVFNVDKRSVLERVRAAPRLSSSTTSSRQHSGQCGRWGRRSRRLQGAAGRQRSREKPANNVEFNNVAVQ
eukprot:11374992-Heterocapsa_arctica.AAC.1